MASSQQPVAVHSDTNAPMQTLAKLRSLGGQPCTAGLRDDEIERFLALDPRLTDAIHEATRAHTRFSEAYPDLVDRDESQLIEIFQESILNFYPPDARSPYVPLAARGPWIVTCKGAVVYDCGGYGMLGFGHAPQQVLEGLTRESMMANVMTATVSQKRFSDRLRAEVGRKRNKFPYAKFVCCNSGSEANSLAAKLVDVNAKQVLDPGGMHEGKARVRMSLVGSFHGRTDKPARYSHSTQQPYVQHLESFAHAAEHLWTVPINDAKALEQTFEKASEQDCFIDSLWLEPVQGEGNPGVAITSDFYTLARKLTQEHGCLLLVDSIQAGIRAHGFLSVVDYPGFEHLPPPDMETWSKALNAGQYPLSVLGLAERAAALYRPKIYGNTMTTNARAMEVACEVLDSLTTAVRENICAKGKLFKQELLRLQSDFPQVITRVEGTGLLFSCELSDKIRAFGEGSVEETMRKRGVNIIHGGKNSLRFTPNFQVTDHEAKLILDVLRETLATL